MAKRFMYVCFGILALTIVAPAVGDDGAWQLVRGGDPAWSPLADQIAFVRYSDQWDRWLIYTIPATGGDVTLIDDGMTWNHQEPAWSPDGNQIAFTADGAIRVMPASGGMSTLVFYGGSGTSQESPTWSPNGIWIAFVFRDGSTSDIWVVPAAGGAATRITYTNNAACPAWSPDINLFAFSLDYDIWIAPVTGGTSIQMTSGPAQDYWPAWSPDGTCIAYWSYQGGEENIWVIGASGGTPTQVTLEGGAIPSWSPDGSQIAFQANRGGSLDYIWIIDAPSGCPTSQTTWGSIKAKFGE